MAEPGPRRSGSKLDVEIVRGSPLWDGLAASDAMLAEVAEAAFGAGAPAAPGAYEVALLLTDDAGMQDLNHAWRGKDAPTNVLSFPAGELPGETLGAPRPLGDVVLAAETIRREADEQGISVSAHVLHLVVHGILHLLGHDHETRAAAETMEALETDVLAAFGIADPYVEGELAEPEKVLP